ncbi:hypothetical protein SLEP1_g3440 [Rubroshorea leprosula]|uniref:Hydroxyproline-rich glycoprotein family protein n=1 Tax=Rubroshorea leprosula TaxID=152421 RepID=A0AAV5HKY9_9ROSI|nr:hypothetical protein SLEP1_g3440 [Rubroshorea leprosula]
MMRTVNDSVETVNAAATAIVSAESRVQPAVVQKRRWGSFWRLYWCFGTSGSHKNSKRIGHAVLVPELVGPGASVPNAENVANPTGLLVPFIAPPSSPAYFLQSEPPSATQSPSGLLSLTSLSVNAYSPGGPTSIFAIGPYAHETQLVTPPAFSALTTEPSTAPFTPPPESVQLTTPSSPEVPFAKLLPSSLEHARRNGGTIQKFGLSHYDFQSYQFYPGSPGGNLISPGSAISNSGTSTPFPDKYPILEFRMGEAPKIYGFEHFTTHKWGSRLGSGSMTPDGMGLGSRLGSGTLTPDGIGLGSGLGSGCLTPDAVDPALQDGFPPNNQISSMAAIAYSENVSKGDDILVNHRVSFELSGEDVARCFESKSVTPTRTVSECPKNMVIDGRSETDGLSTDQESSCEVCMKETSEESFNKASGEAEEAHCYQKHRSVSLGSIKEFNFDSTKREASDKITIRSEWWANEKVTGKETQPGNNWTFFPMLRPEVS